MILSLMSNMKRTRYTSLLGLALIYLLSSSCNSTVIGEGELRKESRKIGSFNKLALNINAHVSIIIADSNSIVLVAQANILENIELKSKGRSLLIHSKQSLKTDKPIEIIMTCSAPEALEINGAGEIEIINPYKIEKSTFIINGSGDIKARPHSQQIKSTINGSGDLELKGEAEDHKIQINGSGDLKASELIVQNYRIDINGSGKVFIHVESKLNVNIMGSGDVNYIGDPEINSKITGKGEINRANKN